MFLRSGEARRAANAGLDAGICGRRGAGGVYKFRDLQILILLEYTAKRALCQYGPRRSGRAREGGGRNLDRDTPEYIPAHEDLVSRFSRFPVDKGGGFRYNHPVCIVKH